MLRVRVLGALGLEHDRQPVPLPRGLARQLLAYLALHPGAQPRALVAARLWPEAAPGLALHRLRTTVWEVRRAIPELVPRVLMSSTAGLALHPGVEVDLAEARMLLEAGAAEAALALLAPGLAEELDQEWAIHGRRDAEEWRSLALDSLVRDAQDAGTALTWARQRLALAPLSEVAHRDVIRLLYLSGDRAGAMAAYERMRLVLDAELGVDPSAASRQLLALVEADAHPDLQEVAEPAPPRPRARPRLPVPTSPLIGRDGELAELGTVVAATRLVSVVGPAGVGKSRLVLALAQREAEERRVPVAFAELATTRRGEACDYVVAAALGVQGGTGRAIREVIVERLDLEPGLLVVDNCEHLIEPVRDLLAHLLRSSPGTRILTTSREPLMLAGEHLLRLRPLPVPAEGDDDSTIPACPAVQLVSAAVTRRSADALQRIDVHDMARLVRRLDGLPLALELAAARIPSLGVTALTERLDRSLAVLSTGPAARGSAGQSALGRHDSLIGTLEWSMTLLTQPERTLLGLVSLLPGPFPLAAAEALADAADLPTDSALALARLVEASLVLVHPGDVWCYSTLQTIQTFGRTLLDDSLTASARRGLVRWAVGFSADIKSREATDELGVNAEASRFLPLVRAALQVAREEGDVTAERRIIIGIESWSTWREQPEVWSWIRDLAAREPEEHPDAEILRMGSLASWRLGQMDLMREFAARTLAADPGGPAGSTTIGCLLALAFAERRWADVVEVAGRTDPHNLGNQAVAKSLASTALTRLGRPEEALELARSARGDAERVGSRAFRAMALLSEGRAYEAAAGPASTEPLPVLAEARRLADSVGAAELVANIDEELGLQALRRGQPEQAREPLLRACLHWLVTRNLPLMAVAIRGLTEALAATGSPEAAARVTGAVEEGVLTAAILASIVRGEPERGATARAADL